jgi:pilus assembly protein CpaB
MNRRALLIALVVAALGATLLMLYLRRFEQEASGGERIILLTAIKPIERGAVITNEMLASREVPMAYVEDRAVKASEKAKIVGLRVGNTVQPQQTLQWTDLAIATDERRDLSSLVVPGSRAVSVRASSDDKSFALIRPGDYVDVLVTMSAGPGDTRSSVVLLQKVLVLAMGLETGAEPLGDKPDMTPRSQREMLLTLSVTLQAAQLLSLAVEKGRISVALRNPDDQSVVDKIPDMSSKALTDKGTIEGAQGGRAGPMKVKSVTKGEGP